MSDSARPYVLVVFGATGFTGRLVAEYLARTVGVRIPWALAGRNRQKLAEVRAAVARINPECASVDLLEASVDDAASLARMTAATRVLITTVGPYAKYGVGVVEACVESATDYVDITGEPDFVNEVIARFDAKAREKQIRVVSTCGFDSIPHDLGVLFTVHKLPHDRPITVEGFVRTRSTFSGGTWQTAIHAFAHLSENLKRERAQVKGTTEGSRSVRGMRPRLRYDRELQAWACPLPTIDPQVVLRSARALEEYGPDFRYGHHAEIHSTALMAGGVVGVGALVALSQVGITRRWLESFKSSGEGPSELERARAWFTVKFRGRAGDKSVLTQVRGGDPGYTETAKMVAESALCLAEDRATLPARYGVLTPAAAMGDALIDRLQSAGMVFEVLEAS